MVDARLTDCGALTDLVAPGARAVELTLESATSELVARLQAQGARVLQGDRSAVFTFAEEGAARAALEASVAAGATVISFLPHRRSLEELFVARARGRAATS